MEAWSNNNNLFINYIQLKPIRGDGSVHAEVPLNMKNCFPADPLPVLTAISLKFSVSRRQINVSGKVFLENYQKRLKWSATLIVTDNS